MRYSGQEIESSQLQMIQTVLKADKKLQYLLTWLADLDAYEDKENGVGERKLDDIVVELENCCVKLKFIKTDTRTTESRVSTLRTCRAGGGCACRCHA